MIQGRSEGATGGLPTRAAAENAGVASMSPNGRVGGAEYGTSCSGEAQRLSAVQISETRFHWMRVRVLQSRKLVPNRPLGALLPLSRSRDGRGLN